MINLGAFVLGGTTASHTCRVWRGGNFMQYFLTEHVTGWHGWMNTILSIPRRTKDIRWMTNWKELGIKSSRHVRRRAWMSFVYFNVQTWDQIFTVLQPWQKKNSWMNWKRSASKKESHWPILKQ